MGYWDYDEPMWEPSEADELFNEIKSKLIDAAKDSIKNDMEYLKSENERLSKRVDELESKEYEVVTREEIVRYKEQNLRREVEREFYKTAIEDLFKNALEESVLWFADNKPHEKPKCNKCNDDRKWVLTWPDGTQVAKKCECAEPDYWYEPQETHIETLIYQIRDDNYPSYRYYRLDRSYQNTKESRYNDYSYNDFGIQFVYDKFCEDVLEKHEQLNYGKFIGFKSKEECQKYCDWLNKRNNKE